MTLDCKIAFTVEQDEWLEAYPGDPLVRPANYSVELWTNNPEELGEWMDEMYGDRVTHLSSEPGLPNLYQTNQSRLKYSHLSIYRFDHKRDLMTMKMTWA